MFSSKKWKWALLLSCVLTLFFILKGYAQGLFYHPDRQNYGMPESVGLSYERVEFASRDGTRLSGWFFPARPVAMKEEAPPEIKGTVIHLHSNAQNMSAHWPFIAWLPAQGFNVFMFDYRGYGTSAGKPEPRGVFEDAQSAIDYVRTRADVDPQRLLVFGQSLGGNNAIAAVGALEREARERGTPTGIRAVVADSPFFSYASMADGTLRGSGRIMNDEYSAGNFVADISPVPLLLIHCTADQIVPYAHSERLMRTAGEPKTLLLIPDCLHLSALADPRLAPRYRETVAAFFEQAVNSGNKF